MLMVMVMIILIFLRYQGRRLDPDFGWVISLDVLLVCLGVLVWVLSVFERQVLQVDVHQLDFPFSIERLEKKAVVGESRINGR